MMSMHSALSLNFEISEGVPIKTRVPREVIMEITFHALMRSEKNNAEQNALDLTKKKDRIFLHQILKCKQMICFYVLNLFSYQF